MVPFEPTYRVSAEVFRSETVVHCTTNQSHRRGWSLVLQYCLIQLIHIFINYASKATVEAGRFWTPINN
jgi:hypothetical protein